MVRISLATLVLALVAVGCSDEHDRFVAPTPSISLTVDQLLSAPDSLIVDGFKLSVEISLNRDFMPQSPPEGYPMTAWLALNGFPPGSYPESAEVYLWVIRDDGEVWSVTMIPDGISQTNGGATYRGWQGPLWDPDILVDVVIGVRTSPDKLSLGLFRDVLITKSS